MLQKIISLFSRKALNKVNAKKDGVWKEFNKQGVLISEGLYADNVRSGSWKFYYETGELAIEETYHAGRMEGTFKSYYKNGKMISLGQYINNKREGEFLIFNESGTVIKTMKFQEDILIDEVDKLQIAMKA